MSSISKCSDVARRGGGGGERTLPLKKGKSGEKNSIGVKNLKTIKVGSLFVAVNSEPKIIEPPTLDLPTIKPSGVARGSGGRIRSSPETYLKHSFIPPCRRGGKDFFSD